MKLPTKTKSQYKCVNNNLKYFTGFGSVINLIFQRIGQLLFLYMLTKIWQHLHKQNNWHNVTGYSGNWGNSEMFTKFWFLKKKKSIEDYSVF